MKKLVRTMCLLAMTLLAVLCAGCKAPAEPAVKLAAPGNLRIEGRTLCWDPVEHADGYVVYVAHAEHNVTACSFDLSGLAVGDYEVEVLAVGDGKHYSDSEWVKVDYTAEEIVKRGYDETGLFFQLMEDGSGYILSRGKRDVYSEEEWILPTYYRGLPVKEIADWGMVLTAPGSLAIPRPFEEGQSLCNQVTRKMTLPACLERIGVGAFGGMVKLEAVVFPDTVTELGNSCFYGCLRLEHITLSASLKTIGRGCFSGCSLQELTLPEGLEEIGTNAFSSEYGKNGKKGQTDFIGWTDMCEFAEVHIPASVKRIGVGAFYNCRGLSKLTFGAPENLEHLDAAFRGTAWDKALPDGWNYIGDILYAYKGEFPSGTRLQMPDAAKRIAGCAFIEQKGLEAVYIPDGVKLIGRGIFYGCKALTEVRLPSDLIELPYNCFYDCEKLTTIRLPDTLRTIKNGCFSGCKALTAVEFPVGLKIIEDNAFGGCDGLTAIALPEGLEELGGCAFGSCKYLTTVRLPSSFNMKRIGSAFEACLRLKAIELPEGLIEIESTCSGCPSLTAVKLPNSLQKIGERSFSYCGRLQTIVIPNAVTEIGEKAFQYCKALQTIVLPRSLTRFYESTFEECTALQTIYYQGTESEWRILIGSITTDPRTLHIDNATVYYYSETEPSADGNYWHYVDGEPCVWAK